MTVHGEMAQLARELSQLAASGNSARLGVDGLDHALAARRETVGLLRLVLRDVTEGRPSEGRERPAAASQVARLPASVELGVEADPIGALERALARHPTPPGRSTMAGGVETDRGGGTGGGRASAARGWAAVGRWTVLAREAWLRTIPAALLPEERWSVTADVAALAQAVTVLDRDLADAAAQPGVGRDVRLALSSASRSGLRTAAAEVAATAAAGALPLLERPELLPVMMVRGAEDLLVGVARLAGQVSAAPALSPRSVVLIATGQARMLSTAGRALRTARRVEPAGRADALVRDLAAVVAGGHQLAPARAADDQRPVLQTQELVMGLSRLAGRDLGERRSRPRRELLAAAAAVVDRAPAVLRAVARHADESVRAGRWLVPNTSESRDPAWIRADRAREEPRLTALLTAAAVRAAAAAAPVVSGASSGLPPPRVALQGVAEAYRRTRPTSPLRGDPRLER